MTSVIEKIKDFTEDPDIKKLGRILLPKSSTKVFLLASNISIFIASFFALFVTITVIASFSGASTFAFSQFNILKNWNIFIKIFFIVGFIIGIGTATAIFSFCSSSLVNAAIFYLIDRLVFFIQEIRNYIETQKNNKKMPQHNMIYFKDNQYCIQRWFNAGMDKKLRIVPFPFDEIKNSDVPQHINEKNYKKLHFLKIMVMVFDNQTNTSFYTILIKINDKKITKNKIINRINTNNEKVSAFKVISIPPAKKISHSYSDKSNPDYTNSNYISSNNEGKIIHYYIIDDTKDPNKATLKMKKDME